MKQLHVEITMENAAFEESPAHELAQILMGLAKAVIEHRAVPRLYVLRDHNGNSCGTAGISEAVTVEV